MPIQSEAALENGLIATLQQMNYEYVHIEEGKNLYANFSWRNTTANGWKSLGVQSSRHQSLTRF